ncbi:hypothetical protein N7G274_004032 [Stereocaulon virgatum]|uniref:LAGLIDADG homing endonuclease n=1 Tax=Stereocaulon virgatum TaxID=373712 RepID=A0ABR4AAS3_9LECA
MVFCVLRLLSMGRTLPVNGREDGGCYMGVAPIGGDSKHIGLDKESCGNHGSSRILLFAMWKTLEQYIEAKSELQNFTFTRSSKHDLLAFKAAVMKYFVYNRIRSTRE